MPTIIENLKAERDAALATIDQIAAEASGEAEGTQKRDLNKSELELMSRTSERVKQIDAQLKPLIDMEQLREASDASVAKYFSTGPQTPAGGAPAGVKSGGAQVNPREYSYASRGELIADACRARAGDKAASYRLSTTGLELDTDGSLTRAAPNVTTADTPGLLPRPLIGPVETALDATRPLIQSLGVKPLTNIPGKTFDRPTITTHVQVAAQASELAGLQQGTFVVNTIPMTKKLYGGTVAISRQDLDWTSPAAWDALLADFADIYSVATETTVSADMNTAVTQEQELTTALAATPTVAELIAGLYGAAQKVYAGAKRMPTHLWMDLTQWAQWGTVLDTVRATAGSVADSKAAEFTTYLLGIPRVVVPSWGTSTAILGVADRFEVYEERIGFVSAVKPTVMGVELAYGGYMADGPINAAGFCKIVNKV